MKVLSIEEIDEVSGGDFMDAAIAWGGGVVGVGATAILTVAGAPVGLAALVGFGAGFAIYQIGTSIYHVVM